jgi:hypothetical protein
MANNSIVAQIDAEIAKLIQAHSLLANTGKIVDQISERLTKKAAKATKPVKSVKVAKAAKVAKAPKVAKTKKRRTLSPEARQRIADAQRKRWAAQKGKA